MSTITLDQIREDTERKYAPVVIDLGDGQSCSLRQALRLPKEQRKLIAKLQNEVNDVDQEDDDAEDRMVSALQEILRTAAADRDSADALLDSVGDDLTVLLSIIEVYGKATQLPEASPSPS